MSFLAGMFLLGFAALAVPWWLHRMNERTPAQTTVASLMLLREVDEPVRTRRRLAHRALLALRLALLATLALAFAQPVVETAADLIAPRQAAPAKLVVLDSSFSMRREAVWADALATARALFDAEAGDSAIAGGERLTLLPDFAVAQPGWSRFDFAGLPERLATLVAALPEPVGGWEVHIVSDFQASAVPERFNALVGGTWLFVLHPVGDVEDNWAVESVTMAADRVDVVVASYAAVGRQFTIRVAGDQADIHVAAGSRQRASLSLPSSPREQTAHEVDIAAADALPGDDVRRFIQPAAESAAIAVLAPNADANALGFLAAALEASGATPSVVAGDAAWPHATTALALLDPGEMQPAMQRRVERHLRQGGGALLIVGPRLRRDGRLPIGGDALAGRTFVAAPRRVVVADASHPIVGEGGLKGWDEVVVERSLTFADSQRRTILALAPADTEQAAALEPLLVERRIGTGRLLILLTALDRTWSSLVLRPAFVGLIGDAMDYLVGNRPLQANAGAALALPSASAQIIDAQGVRVKGFGETAARSVVRVDDPGVYTVYMPGRKTLLAVNMDTRESDLRPVPAALLDRWQEATKSRATPTATAQEAAVDAQYALAPWLLTLAAALLIAESLAANIGGRGRGDGAAVA